jgi:hypothetical protein
MSFTSTSCTTTEANTKNRNDLLDLLTQKYGVRPSCSIIRCIANPLFQKKGCGAYDCPVLDAWWDNSFSFPCVGIDDESMRIMCERPHPCGEGPARWSAGKNGTVP